MRTRIIRREFVVSTAAACCLSQSRRLEANNEQAQIAITLDLEMSRNFPAWNDTHWDYEKGNLNQPTIEYAVEAARRVKARGGRLHFFVVGRTLEQENVAWLDQLAADGHPLGNHTYDHVNIRATRLADVQHRFQRSPWLVAGREPAQVIRDNIRLTTEAMKSRLGVAPSGFRTPGGFGRGVADRSDLQQMLRELGFGWISSQYVGHKIGPPGEEPTAEVIESIAAAISASQPYKYESDLVEIPMSPISDIGAFRAGRWRLDWFLRAVEAAVSAAIQRRAVYDFLGHPSCLYVMDPRFKTIDLICDLVQRSNGGAVLADLATISRAV